LDGLLAKAASSITGVDIGFLRHVGVSVGCDLILRIHGIGLIAILTNSGHTSFSRMARFVWGISGSGTLIQIPRLRIFSWAALGESMNQWILEVESRPNGKRDI
jgi:hypothetical protein